MTQEEFKAFSYEIINWGNIPISSKKNCGVIAYSAKFTETQF